MTCHTYQTLLRQCYDNAFVKRLTEGEAQGLRAQLW